MSYQLFTMGNPLLDMQVTNGEGLLQKYGLKSNDAILAEEKHQPMYVVSCPCFRFRDTNAAIAATVSS